MIKLDPDKKEHQLILGIITQEKSISLDEIADKTTFCIISFYQFFWIWRSMAT
jgi:hypothetical protein